MKKLLIILLLSPLFGLGQSVPKLALVDSAFLQKALSVKIDVVNTIADLKAKGVYTADAVVLVQGKTSSTDGMGAFYRWVVGSSDVEDMTFLNIVTSTANNAGRWVRLNVRNLQLPHGVLALNGGIKTFYASGVTNASSEFVVNLTYEGTSTGTAFCTTILKNSATAYPTISSTNDAVNGSVKAELPKQTTYFFTRGNNIVLGALGTLGANTFIAAPANTKVRAEITCL